MAQSANRVPILDRPHFLAWRMARYIVVQLRQPHRVISTSGSMGGQSENLRYLVNHQTNEARGHMDRHDLIARMPEEQYHELVAKELGLNPAEMALMGTAANMNYLGRRTAEFQGVTVDAFVTAGVEGNATRPGDPASWFESEKGMQYLKAEVPHPLTGTINTILVINKALTAGAHSRAIMTMVEAKTAALMELAVGSRYSTHLATGTGTDQFILAAPLVPGVKPLRWAGTHVKLGQLIGEAVKGATLEALRWQNGLEASTTRSIYHALGRFGLNEKTLLERVEKLGPAKSAELMKNNLLAVVFEPRVAACAYGYAAVLDRLQYGTLSGDLAVEVLRDQAASTAVAISGQPARWPEFWEKTQVDPADRLGAFVQGLAQGWQVRWALAQRGQSA